MDTSVSALPFHSKDEYVFQLLCRDVLAHDDSEISSCEVYGTRGQSQRGVDVLANHRNDDQIELGQCKRYKSFTTDNLAAAVKEFFSYWHFWKRKKVRRFVLFVACDLSDRAMQDEIMRRRKRFRKHQIRFDVWGYNDLKDKLRPYRQIVQGHYPMLVFAIDQAAGASAAALMAKLDGDVLKIAHRAKFSAKDGQIDLAMLLIQAVLSPSIVEGDEGMTAERFFSRMRSLVLAQPQFAKRLFRATTDWRTALPFAQQRVFWPFYFVVRGLC